MCKTNDQRDIERKAHLWFLSNLMSTFIGVLIGFVFVKITISFYGETTNGVMRFINQIIMYINGISAGFFLIFSIKIIHCFKRGEISKLNYYVKEMMKWIKISAIIFMVIAIIFVTSYSFYFNQGKNLVFLLLLTTVIVLPSFFSMLFLMKDTTLLNATNNGYIPSLIRAIVKIILFCICIYIILIRTPQLEYILSNGKKILEIKNFGKNSIAKYNLIWGMLIMAFEPIISAIIMKQFVKNKIDLTIVYIPKDKKEIIKIKKELKKGMIQSFGLNIAFILLYNTDEFAISLLKNIMPISVVLKSITIYGLYLSMVAALGNIILQYSESQKMILGSHTNISPLKYKDKVKKIKTKTILTSLVFMLISFLVVPSLVRFLFQPENGANYFDINFVLPMLIFYFLYIINNIVKLEFELSNKLKINIIIYLIEALVNVILSFSLVMHFGVYSVIWSSVIASFIKIIIFEVMIYKQNSYYTSHFYIEKKAIPYIVLFLLLFLLEVITFNIININSVINLMYPFVYFLFYGSIIVFEVLFYAVLIKNSKNNISKNHNKSKKIAI